MLQIYVNLPNSDYGKLVGRKVDVHSLPILNFMQGNQIYPKVEYDHWIRVLGWLLCLYSRCIYVLYHSEESSIDATFVLADTRIMDR